MSESINRPLKFRAWQERTKRMYYEIDLLSDGLVNIFDEETQLATIIGAYRPDDTVIEIPVMQFTGFKDKNGKEIYYDDLFLYDGSPCGHAQVNELHVSWWIIDIDRMNDPLSGIEVVGNIYENPELMKLA